MTARHYGTRESVSARRRHDYAYACDLLHTAAQSGNTWEQARARSVLSWLALGEHTARAQDRILDTAEVA